MSDYNDEATGGAIAGGCSVITHTTTVTANFALGSIVYRKYRAQQGVLEKSVIKRILVNQYNEVLYIDRLNAIFNEDELVSHTTALALVASYKQAQIDAILEYIDQLC